MTFPVAPGRSTFDVPPATQTWRDRIRDGVYFSPTGKRIQFDFENVSRAIDLRNTAFQFPGVNGVYIQGNGSGARKYPLRCFFTGDTCDLQATAFEAALLEPGVGRLQHPLYGTFDVVPMGTIGRRDDLKTAANQSVVEVSFWPTLRTVYPTLQKSASNEITTAIELFDVEAAQLYSDITFLENAVNQAGLIETLNNVLNEIGGALDGIANTTADVAREFRDAQDLINRSLDVLVGKPLLLVQQLQNLISIPARALAGIESRIDGYSDLADRLMDSDAGNPGGRLVPGSDVTDRTYRITNDFHSTETNVLAAVSAIVRSTLNHTFTTRPEAIGAADQMFDKFDAAVAWRDDAFTDIAGVSANQLDTGGSIQALQDAVAFNAGRLVQLSFSLVPERIIVLDRARTIIDLAGQLYGSTSDDRLNALINNNDLPGSAILEMPRGTVIRYYPEAA